MPITPVINFLGCGRLAKTIGRLVVEKKVARVGAVLNTSLENASKASQFLGEGKAFTDFRDLPPADVSFITTRDDLIESACKRLISENVNFKKNSVVVHCSGSLTSKNLLAAKRQGCSIASIHPIKSFANPEASVRTFNGTFCAFEGDSEAFPLAKQIFTGIGGEVITISSDKKKIYHVGGVMANNYLVTLHRKAVECYTAAGIEESVAKKIVSMLMTDAFTNLQNLTHKQALTGPINRGDYQTVRDHMEALKQLSDDGLMRKLYADLGLATLGITDNIPQTLEKLAKVLSEDNDEVAQQPTLFTRP